MEILPFISFFTGVISILSPCILPIIPIFVAFSLKTKTKTEILAFVLGLLSIFVAIIFLTGFFTSIVYGYMFYIRIVSALILLVIGFNVSFLDSVLQRICYFSDCTSYGFRQCLCSIKHFTVLFWFCIDIVCFEFFNFKNRFGQADFKNKTHS